MPVKYPWATNKAHQMGTAPYWFWCTASTVKIQFSRDMLCMLMCLYAAAATMLSVTICMWGFFVFGTTTSHRTFYELYKPEIGGLDFVDGNAIYIDLDPPSTQASCIILCGVTPGCLWAKFTGTGRCGISDAFCPQLATNQSSSLVAIVQNGVNIWSTNYLSLISPYPHLASMFCQTYEMLVMISITA